MVEFYSPLYLASMVAQDGVNKNEELVKKYGTLEKSFDFSLMQSRSFFDPNNEFMERQDASSLSNNSFISGISMISQLKNVFVDKDRSDVSKSSKLSKMHSVDSNKSPGLRSNLDNSLSSINCK